MPSVSPRQRRWAFAVKGPKWTKKHHFDKLRNRRRRKSK